MCCKSHILHMEFKHPGQLCKLAYSPYHYKCAGVIIDIIDIKSVMLDNSFVDQ